MKKNKTKSTPKHFSIVSYAFLYTLFSCSHLIGENHYDGISLFQKYENITYSWLAQFLPYNPIILEAGAFRGDETYAAAKIWPNGQIFAFEPCHYSFNHLRDMVFEKELTNVKVFNLALNTYNGKASLFTCHGMYGQDDAFEYASSLLPLKRDMEMCCKGPTLKVPCVVLDDWCRENQIDHIDILRLELEGLELQVLESSPNILKAVKIIYMKSFIHPHRVSMTEYPHLKRYLEAANFVLLAHWYTTGVEGHVLFLSRELFDSYFKKSLGIYLEM